jgi:NAD(P)-dependent dehydrogenase (short-subunit alcohol dehydrogenase family)
MGNEQEGTNEVRGDADQDLRGKTVVVLGAGGGLGSGMATRFAARGTRIVISDYEGSSLRALEARLRDSGVEVASVQADVSKPADVEAIKVAAVDQFGGVDIVCNTVGVSVSALHARVWEISEEDWRWVLAVNFWGVLNVIRTFVPVLVARGSGHILSTASTVAMTAPIPGSGPYVASKHAVIGVSEALQQDLRAAGSDVRVSVILPGTVKSKFASNQRNRQPEYGPPVHAAKEEALQQAHIDKNGTPGEVLADKIIAEMCAGRFYIFGRDKDIDWVEKRSAGIVCGTLPPPPVAVFRTP